MEDPDDAHLKQLRDEMRRAFGVARRRELIDRYGIDAIVGVRRAWERILVGGTYHTS